VGGTALKGQGRAFIATLILNRFRLRWKKPMASVRPVAFLLDLTSVDGSGSASGNVYVEIGGDFFLSFQLPSEESDSQNGLTVWRLSGRRMNGLFHARVSVWQRGSGNQ